MGLLSKLGGATVGLGVAIFTAASAPVTAGLALAGAALSEAAEDDERKNAHRKGHEDGFREGVKDTAEKAEKGQLK